MPREGIEPLYFGTTEKPLFGCYHVPQSGPTRDCGIVLCYPMGQEYIRSHRTYRQLAVRLSRVGFDVLRFDFYGCGDSAGDCEQGQIRQWLTDISTAVSELRRRCGSAKVCLVGLRLGGALSMMVGAERGDIDHLVLWNPIISGKAYIEELKAAQKEMLKYAYAEPKYHTNGDKPTEILGFPLTDFMLAGLEKIDLLAVWQKPANNVFLIESNKETREGRLMAHLTRLGTQLEYQHLPCPRIWSEEPQKGIVPHQLLQSVVSQISRVYP